MNTTTDRTTPVTEPTHRHSPLTPEDAGRIVAPQAPVWHPDSTRVAYSTAVMVRDGTDSYLYEAGVDLPSRRLTHEGYSHSPAWSPDGQTLAFLSTRFGEAGLHLMDGRGGESHRLLRFRGTPRSLAWAPDSRHVVVEVLTPPPPSGDPRVVRRLRYDLNGTGFLGDRVWQVQVIDTATGSTTIVGPPDHHHWYPRWAADGRLALVTSRRPDWDLEWVWDVYVVDWRADQWTCLTASDGVSLMPTFSRDGARVAFFHNHSSTTSSTADYHLHVAPSDGSAPARCLTHAYDRGATASMVPSRGQYAGELSDGRWLWQGNVAGQQWLLATGPDGATTPLVKHLASAALSPDGTLVAGLTLEASRPSEVAVVSLATATRSVLTDLNPWLRERRLAPPPRVVSLPSPAGPVESLVWRPADADGPLPLVVNFHGGPHGAAGPYFSFAPQMLASHGYLVAAVNFRGSAGFGQAFADLVHANWGPQEGEDGMALIHHLAAAGEADPRRVGVYGGSYGGFMTNWMVTHYPTAIAAGVTLSTVSHLATLAYGIDHWESIQTDMGGEPWAIPDYYRQHSPLSLVHRIEAPLLILHGEEDQTCPLLEAEMLFVALRRLKKTVEWVRYPGESHGFIRAGRRETRVDAHQRLLDWFNRHLAP